MFCVIQQVQLKKPNRYGAYRELEVEQDNWTIGGKPPIWRYRYTGGRFERPHLEAYKISLHRSYRESGKVKKRQYSIRTMSYFHAIAIDRHNYPPVQNCKMVNVLQAVQAFNARGSQSKSFGFHVVSSLCFPAKCVTMEAAGWQALAAVLL